MAAAHRMTGRGMQRYDVTDEAIIDASPDVVYRTFVDEMNGETSWSAPHQTFKQLQAFLG